MSDKITKTTKIVRMGIGYHRFLRILAAHYNISMQEASERAAAEYWERHKAELPGKRLA